MPTPAKSNTLLWASLGFYLLARLCQLFADRLPSLLIVILHVLPPAIFALVHGSRLYRLRGMAAFTALCLGVGGLSESLSLRTGFPFGHYSFTSVMGPKLFQLPLLLVLAYLGIGYCSWVLSLLILGAQPLRNARILATPLLAALLMLAWDLSMEADWATVDRAWIWTTGGPFYGVPITNFLGWYLTAYLFYQAFALSRYAIPTAPGRDYGQGFWQAPILLYLTCALGNLLLPLQPMAPPIVFDPTGKPWQTQHILAATSAISLFLMAPLALLAWLRLSLTSNKSRHPAHLLTRRSRS